MLREEAGKLAGLMLFAVACGATEHPGELDTNVVEAAATAPAASCSAKSAVLTMYEDFETYPFESVTEHVYPGSAVSRTTRSARAGTSSMRAVVGEPEFTPEQCSLRRYRAETQARSRAVPWDDGKSYWWGVSFNPLSFPGDAFTLLQLHAPVPAGNANGVSNAPCSFDGNSVSITPRTMDGRVSYVLSVLERGGQSSGKGAGSNTTQVWWEPMQFNHWTDFVINFSLSTNKQGYVNVWRNGQLIYSKAGLTNVNTHDSCGKPIPADQHASLGPNVGIYGPSCIAGSAPGHSRELLVDELRTAVGPNGYGVVAPECHSAGGGSATGGGGLSTSPAAAWNFDEGAGTIARDVSGNDNVAVLKNGLGFVGRANTSLSFDGLNDYGEVADSSSLNVVGKGITASCWVNFADTGDHQIFIGKPISVTTHQSPYFSYALLGNYAGEGLLRPRFLVTLGGVRHDVAASATITPGWHFLAGTYDGASLRLYVDGIESGTVAAQGSLTSFSTPLRLGANGLGDEVFKGRMDNVRIYPRALSAHEIANDMPIPVKPN